MDRCTELRNRVLIYTPIGVSPDYLFRIRSDMYVLCKKKHVLSVDAQSYQQCPTSISTTYKLSCKIINKLFVVMVILLQ